MYCQWQEYLADIVRNSRYPTSYYTQHCCPWLQSHVLLLSITGCKAQRSLWFATSLQTVRCTKPVWFPTLAALPSQFIFYNSRRLLGLYNVTLMRWVSGCAPSGSNLFFFCPNSDRIRTVPPYKNLSLHMKLISLAWAGTIAFTRGEKNMLEVIIWENKRDWRKKNENKIQMSSWLSLTHAKKNTSVQTQTPRRCIPLSNRLPLLHKEGKNMFPGF